MGLRVIRGHGARISPRTLNPKPTLMNPNLKPQNPKTSTQPKH